MTKAKLLSFINYVQNNLYFQPLTLFQLDRDNFYKSNSVSRDKV